jgi:hypothetical protein
MNKLVRRTILSALFFLPAERRAAVSGWLRGRHEKRRVVTSDCVFVTCPKSGRTWLRVMLSRLLQRRHDLPGDTIVGSSAFNRKYPSLPNIFFTHDSFISYYTGNRTDKRDYYGKRIVLLVRDPRDIAVSAYFQWKYRMDKLKKATHVSFFEGRDVTLYEFAMHPQGSLRRTIDLMNSWRNAMPDIADLLVVRYEDLRSDPVEWFKRITTFINLAPGDEEIRDAVEYSSLENMKKLERDRTFGTSGRRFGPGKQDSGDAYKVRRGKVGGYRDYFTDDQVIHIDRLINTTLAADYGYTRGRQV